MISGSIAILTDFLGIWTSGTIARFFWLTRKDSQAFKALFIFFTALSIAFFWVTILDIGAPEIVKQYPRIIRPVVVLAMVYLMWSLRIKLNGRKK